MAYRILNHSYMCRTISDIRTYLKPNDMENDDFYTIVDKAASKYNTESEFENAIKETLSKNVN